MRCSPNFAVPVMVLAVNTACVAALAQTPTYSIVGRTPSEAKIRYGYARHRPNPPASPSHTTMICSLRQRIGAKLEMHDLGHSALSPSA